MIKAENISKIYHQGNSRIEAVKNATLLINRRESVLITGPSGAGKSTFLHILGGLDKPTKGILFIDGTDFYTINDRKRSQIRNGRIGFVFQFYHLLPEFSVLENVMLPALIGKKQIFRSKKDIKIRATQLLNIVGLGKRALHRPSELSGGEMQRSAVARSLMNFPEILLCDEPTGNLDSRIGNEILEYLWMLKDKEDIALVIVTHNEHENLHFDKRFTITDGILKESAKAKNKFQIVKD